MEELPLLIPNRGWDPRILAFRSADVVTVFAVLTRRWTLLVDTLYSRAGALELARRALEAAARLHGGPAPPLLVINTHADWDHAWGNGVFAGPEAAFPAPVLGTRECARRLRQAEDAAELESMRAREPVRFAGASLVSPTLAFEGALEIDCGDLLVHLLPAPGHVPGQVVVWLPEIRHLLGADAVEHPMPFVQGPGHLQEMIGTLEAFRRLAPLRLLACHDGLDGDPGLIQRNLDYFGRVREAARAHPQVDPASSGLDLLLELPFEEFCGGVPQEAREFYRGAHLKALRAALAEVQDEGGEPRSGGGLRRWPGTPGPGGPPRLGDGDSGGSGP